MDAIVLVGGEGTRLRPLTYDTPKQMLPIVDRPLVEHVVSWLGRYGVGRVVLSLGYRPDAFVEAYPDNVIGGVRLSYAIEPELLDTAGAVRFAAEVGEVSGRFLVVNGDVLTDFDVSSLVAFHTERGAEATIYLTPVPDPSAFGVVPTDGAGRVIAFIEKPPPGTAPTNLINAGTYVLEESVLGRIPGGRRVSIERETFPALVADRGLFALPSDAYWLDTGTPEMYLQAQLDILNGSRRAARRPP
jgi:mannose-1-phosphate guanylyltransferase